MRDKHYETKSFRVDLVLLSGLKKLKNEEKVSWNQLLKLLLDSYESGKHKENFNSLKSSNRQNDSRRKKT